MRPSAALPRTRGSPVAEMLGRKQACAPLPLSASQRTRNTRLSVHAQLHCQPRPLQLAVQDRLAAALQCAASLRQSAMQAGATASLALLMAASPAMAEGAPPMDSAKVGTCLLGNCQGELVQCIADTGCLQNLVCLNSCAGAPDVTACQLRCGDLYEDKAVTIFNNCALSQKKCVPQRVDATLFPVPPECALDTKFDMSAFTGRWFITAGLNPLFDLFDCQEHFFEQPQPGTLVGTINWRISKGAGDFLERSTKQTFVQQANPAILWNHGNQYLHYEDDWYVLASKKDEYVFIYYKGNNDAWKGYGGAVIYTRASSLPEEYVPELQKAAEAAGIDWSQIKRTDNSCKPRTSRRASPRFEGDLKSFGKGFTVVDKGPLSGESPETRAEGRKIQDIEELLSKFAEKELQDAKNLAAEIERDVEAEETVLALDFEQVKNWFGNLLHFGKP